MYLIDAEEMDKIRSLPEAQLVNEYSENQVLFKYPAHDVDSFGVVTIDELEWMYENVQFGEIKDDADYNAIHNECYELANELNGRASFEEVEWEPLSKYSDVDNVMMVGAALTCELDNEYMPDKPEDDGWISVRESVEMAGYTVIDVEYGSRLHNKWNTFIRD